jgi:hypothetical protein
MQNLSAIVLVSTVLAACGGNSEFSAGGALSIEQLPDELAGALCQAEKACNPFFYGIAFQNADCKSLLSDQLKDAALSQIEAAITANTLKYDGGKARNCVSAVSSGSCGVLDNNLPAACREAFVGSVAPGGDCDIDAQCSGLSRCQVTAGMCPGKCAPRASAGVACSADGDCALGLTCSVATAHCAAPAESGEPCKGGSDAECAAGLLCIGNDDAQRRAGTCQTAEAALTKRVGDACDLQQGPWCEAGLSCVVEAVLAPSYKCHVIADPGGECGAGLPTECPSGQYCPLALSDLATGKLTATCQALPAEGEPCAPALSLSRCAANLVCDDTTTPLKPVCVTRHTLGQSCSSDALCRSQHCVNRTCVPESQCAQ